MGDLACETPARLAAECAVFLRYLADLDLPAGLAERYAEAHRALLIDERRSTRFERGLVAVARSAPWLASLADTYAGLAARKGLLRRKLVLVLALAETSPRVHAALLEQPERSRALATLQLIALGFAFGARALIAIPVFLVFRAGCAVLGPSGSGGRA